MLSKGRPDCFSARTLLDMGYPGDVIIVCGNDDETIPEYVNNFGNDMVVVFDKREWWQKSDMMDAYGMTGASGIAPVRNYIVQLARDMGYDRCWQFDDDMVEFRINHKDEGDSETITDGKTLFEKMDEVEQFARKSGIPTVGFTASRRSWLDPCTVGRNVGSIHNTSTERPMPYRARIYEDAVLTLDQLRRGSIQYNFRHLQAVPASDWYGGTLSKKSLGGGMKAQYDAIAGESKDIHDRKSIVAVNFAGYVTVAMPMARLLKVYGKGRCGGSYHEKQYRPELIRDTWRREG